MNDEAIELLRAIQAHLGDLDERLYALENDPRLGIIAKDIAEMKAGVSKSIDGITAVYTVVRGRPPSGTFPATKPPEKP